MNLMAEIDELLGLGTKYDYVEGLGREAADSVESVGFLASQELIFGKSFSGSAEVWSNQQMNSIPTFLASPES